MSVDDGRSKRSSGLGSQRFRAVPFGLQLKASFVEFKGDKSIGECMHVCICISYMYSKQQAA